MFLLKSHEIENIRIRLIRCSGAELFHQLQMFFSVLRGIREKTKRFFFFSFEANVRWTIGKDK